VNVLFLVLSHTLCLLIQGPLLHRMEAVPAHVTLTVGGLLLSLRLTAKDEDENSTAQLLLLVFFVMLSASDLWEAWFFFSSPGDGPVPSLAFLSVPFLIAGITSIVTARRNFPSNVRQDPKKTAAYEMLLTHGCCVFFPSASFWHAYPVPDRAMAHWATCSAGLLVSAWLLAADRRNVPVGLPTVFCCVLVAMADAGAAFWSVMAPPPTVYAPSPAILVVPYLAAAVACLGTASRVMRGAYR
ncbi:unnamed protein product, partial [Ectocarpus sp. 13 AM-2016]